MGFRIDYTEIDIWIKDNPDASYKDFLDSGPKIDCSSWSFIKRKHIVLGLPLTKSMKSGYRKGSTRKNKNSRPGIRSTRWVYTAVAQYPVDEIHEKKGLELFKDIIDKVNQLLKLRLEVAEVKLFSQNKNVFEVRNYNK